MGQNPKCKVCGREIDRTKEQCYKFSNGYFHLDCLEGFKEQHKRAKYTLVDVKVVEELDVYVAKIYDYLTTQIGMKVNYGDLVRQCKDFKTKYKYSYNGIYLSLKYFYGVKKMSPEKSNNRIGIVPYVYEEARTYYENLNKKKELINANIYKQKDNVEPVRIVPKRDVARERVHIDLDKLIEEELQKGGI